MISLTLCVIECLLWLIYYNLPNKSQYVDELVVVKVHFWLMLNFIVTPLYPPGAFQQDATYPSPFSMSAAIPHT